MITKLFLTNLIIYFGMIKVDEHIFSYWFEEHDILGFMFKWWGNMTLISIPAWAVWAVWSGNWEVFIHVR